MLDRPEAHEQLYAMYALPQAEALPPRYSLCTGGVGVALFLAAGIEGDAGFPTYDRSNERGGVCPGTGPGLTPVCPFVGELWRERDECVPRARTC